MSMLWSNPNERLKCEFLSCGHGIRKAVRSSHYFPRINFKKLVEVEIDTSGYDAELDGQESNSLGDIMYGGCNVIDIFRIHALQRSQRTENKRYE